MTDSRCTRCGGPRTLYVVGDRHCEACERDLAVIARQDAQRVDRFARFRVARDTTGWNPAA